MMSKTLVLHGYGQQVDELKKKWNRTFKKMGLTDIHYLKGPLTVVNKNNKVGQAWFSWEDSNNKIYNCTKYYDVAESLRYISEYIQQHGPFDTIIGYSQGGTILGLLLEYFTIVVRKILIISAYDSLDSAWIINRTTTYSILLVAGQQDETVPMRHTVCMYDNAQIYTHNGTHSLPNTKEFITRVKKFLE